MPQKRREKRKTENILTESALDKVIESMAIAVVGKLGVHCRKFLQTLEGDAGEISSEFSVLRKYNHTSSYETIDQSLLGHNSDISRTDPRTDPSSFRCRLQIHAQIHASSLSTYRSMHRSAFSPPTDRNRFLSSYGSTHRSSAQPMTNNIPTEA